MFQKILENVEVECCEVFVLFLCQHQHHLQPTENGNVEIKQFEPDPTEAQEI